MNFSLDTRRVVRAQSANFSAMQRAATTSAPVYPETTKSLVAGTAVLSLLVLVLLVLVIGPPGVS